MYIAVDKGIGLHDVLAKFCIYIRAAWEHRYKQDPDYTIIHVESVKRYPPILNIVPKVTENYHIYYLGKFFFISMITK